MDIVTLGLKVDGNGAIRVVDAFTTSTTRAAAAGGALESTAGRLRASFGRLATLIGAGALFGAVVRNTTEAQNAFAQLEAGVKSTGGAAGFTARQLEEMAGGLQRLTAYEDEAIESAQALLLTFTNIRGDVFRDATAATLDLAQRMGGDLKGASIQVGKALQDPIRGMLALRRSGVSFSASQQQVIKDLVNTGRTVEAQRLILKELAVEFGGAAAAARNTFGGALAGLRHAFGDLFEVSPSGTSGVVRFINDLEGLLVKMKTEVLPVVGIAFQWLWGVIRSGIQLWQDLPNGIKVALALFASMALTVPKLASLIVFLTGVVLKLAAAFRAVAAAESLAALLSPAGWLMLGLAAVAAAFGYVGYKALQAANDARKAAEEFRGALATMDEAALRTTSGSLVTQWAVVDKALEEHRETLRALQTLSGTSERDARLPQSPEFQRRAADWLREKLGIRQGAQQSQVAELIAGETQTIQALEAQAELLRSRGTMAAEELKRRREAAQQLNVPPMVDVSTPPDADKINERLARNAEMVKAAQDAVRLAGEQGMAQDRLAIDLDATTKAMQAQADTATRAVLPATLAAIEAERRLKLEALDVTALRVQTQAREDAARASRQAATLADAEGAAQTRLRIDYDALNKTIEAQRNLRGSPEVLSRTVEDIETERMARLAEEQLKIFRSYRERVREVATDLFEDIGRNGIKAFGNLFDRLRGMMLRFFAEMAAKKFMQAIGNNIAGQFANAFGGADKLASGPDRASVALTGSASALTGAASALTAAAARLGGAGAGGGTANAVASGAAGLPGTRENPKGLDPLVVTANRKAAIDLSRQIAKYIGPALAGFATGSAVGASTTNRGVGAAGGAVSGAAAGYAVGGVPGAVIGGLTGAIGGFLSASKRRAEEERMLREVLSRNSQRLQELNENILGLSLFSGRNVAGAEGLARALSGLGGGAIRSKGFAETLKGGETAAYLKRYEQQFGVTIQELGRMAQQLGIELFDSAGRAIPAALKQLAEALRLTTKAATQFTQSQDDLRLRQEAYNKLFDIPDTPQQGLADAYERLGKGAPELLRQLGLANLNIASEAGRKVLLSGLQEIFKLIDAGLLTPDLLGAFGDKEGLIRALLEAKEGLDAFRNTLGNVTTDFPRAMDIILYEQRYGRGTGAGMGRSTPAEPPKLPPDTNPGGGSRSPRAPFTTTVMFTGDMLIVNEAGDTGDDIADKLEGATKQILSRGGFTVVSGSIS